MMDKNSKKISIINHVFNPLIVISFLSLLFLIKTKVVHGGLVYVYIFTLFPLTVLFNLFTIIFFIKKKEFIKLKYILISFIFWFVLPLLCLIIYNKIKT